MWMFFPWFPCLSALLPFVVHITDFCEYFLVTLENSTSFCRILSATPWQVGYVNSLRLSAAYVFAQLIINKGPLCTRHPISHWAGSSEYNKTQSLRFRGRVELQPQDSYWPHLALYKNVYFWDASSDIVTQKLGLWPRSVPFFVNHSWKGWCMWLIYTMWETLS